jgi:hypothetical protein
LPEFRLAACPVGRFAPETRADLRFVLQAPSQAVPLQDLQLTLQGQEVTCRGNLIPLQDRRLISGAGVYEIQSYLGQRRLATARFRVMSDAEILEQVTVAEFQLEVEQRSGHIVRGLRTLRWEEHQAFRPVLRLVTAVQAPNTLARCIVRILHGTTVLRREDLMIPLDRPIRRVRLERMELGCGLPARPRPARLLVSVCVGGKVKGSIPVVVLPPERITNFEGQLTFDAEELPFDPTEYQQIIQRLGLREEIHRPRRWRAWVQRLGLAAPQRASLASAAEGTEREVEAS